MEHARPYHRCFLSPIGSCTPNETPALATPLDFLMSHRRYDTMRTGKVIHAPCGFAAARAILSLMIGTAIVQCVFTLKAEHIFLCAILCECPDSDLYAYARACQPSLQELVSCICLARSFSTISQAFESPCCSSGTFDRLRPARRC